MSAISNKKKQEKPEKQVLMEDPEEILRRKRALESRVGDNGSSSSKPEPTGMAAEKAVGALCFLPKSIHRLASRAADDLDITAKRFFLEAVLIGLEQMGVINAEQHTEALKLPNEYGWKGRK